MSAFVGMLNEMRFGRLTPKSIASFKALTREVQYNDNVTPTVLYPRREDVDRANSTELAKLNTDGYTYTAIDSGAVTDAVQRAKLLSNFMAPETLPLKIDAQVMLIKNMDDTLVNGSMGKIIGFDYKDIWENAMTSSGRWVDDNDQVQLDDDENQVARELRAKQRERFRNSGVKMHPIVRFLTPQGKRDCLIEPDTFKSELPNGEVQAARMQVSPFLLGSEEWTQFREVRRSADFL